MSVDFGERRDDGKQLLTECNETEVPEWNVVDALVEEGHGKEVGVGGGRISLYGFRLAGFQRSQRSDWP